MNKLDGERIKIFEAATNTNIEILLADIEKYAVNPCTLENVIDNDDLNQKGLQVYRYLLYDWAFDEKRRNFSLWGSDLGEQLRTNGFIKMENLLSVPDLKLLQRKVLSLPHLTRKECENLPLKMDILNNKKIQNVFKYCQADTSYTEAELYLRKISHIEPGEYCEDARQYNFHVDKFYPNYKVWFYPFEIKEAHGPLAFFRGSHKNTVKKMKWVFERSVKNENWSRLHFNVEDYHNKTRDLELGEEIRCAAPANTMFIVDTRMFHRRTPAPVGKLRLSFRAILDRNNIFKGGINC